MGPRCANFKESALVMITTAGTVRECIFDLRKRFTPFALQMPHPKNKKAAENPCVTRVFSRLLIKNHPTGLYQILWDEVAKSP